MRNDDKVQIKKFSLKESAVDRNTILIIEDNEMNMDIASYLLTREGFEVLKAWDGDTGLMLAKQEVPDLILLDMHLPIRDGFELCTILKQDVKTAHIKIIAFTAQVLEEERKKTLACGCEDIIIKPIEVGSFAKTVSSYLNLK